MVDLIKDRFEKVTKTLNSFYEFQINENATLKEVNNHNQDLYNFAWSNISNLSIFNDSVCRLFKIRTDENDEVSREKNGDIILPIIDKLVAKGLYIDLLEILEKNIKVKKFPFKDYKAYFESLNLEEYANFYLYTPIISIPTKFTIPNDDIKQVNRIAKATEIQFEIIDIIEEYINDILLFNIKKWFDRTEINYSYNQNEEGKLYLIKLREDYINSWLNCTVTNYQWKTYSKDDLWKELDEIDLSDEKRDEIEKHQLNLFLGKLSSLIYEAMLRFDSTPQRDKKTVIEKELTFLTNFIKGDVSDVLIQRIKNIIDFENPIEILVAFDKISKSNEFFQYDSYIYIPGKRDIYTPKFIAYFFNGYIKRLERELNKMSTEIIPIIKEIASKVFYFKIKGGASKKAIATSLFEKLEKEKHIDINSKNDFINAFIGNAPANKINWIGMFGDLKSFINYSISENLIENDKAKWVITSNIFILDGIQFNNDQINNTKTTSSDEIIKKLVRSFLA